MAADDDLRGQIRALQQQVESYQAILLGGFDIMGSRLDDSIVRVRIVRNAIGFSIEMYDRRDEINRKLEKVGDLLDMIDPTHAEMLEQWKKLWRMEDPSLPEILAFAKQQMKVNAERPKILMLWLRNFFFSFLGFVFALISGFIMFKMTGK